MKGKIITLKITNRQTTATQGKIITLKITNRQTTAMQTQQPLNRTILVKGFRHPFPQIPLKLDEVILGILG